MTGKGGFTRVPRKKFRLLLAAQAVWLTAVCTLVLWWGRLLLRQASVIEELRKSAGLAGEEAHQQWLKTHQMLLGESASFLALIAASTAVLFWLYWRDAKRTRSLQAFFASLTHELRTPLTSIRLQAEAIADEADPAQKELLARLLEDAQGLELQVERVLELARVEGGATLFAQPIELKSWLERAIEEPVRTGAIRVAIEIPPEASGTFILADRVAVQVILRNLIENSIRHSRQESVRIRIRAELKGGGVFLRFTDNGAAIPVSSVKYLGRLFEKGPASQGAGVGLYLVSTLMKRMGGFARFEALREGFEVSLFFSRCATGGSHE